MKSEIYRDKSGYLRKKGENYLLYTPELFPKNGKEWTYSEISEMIKARETKMSWEDIGLMLERTPRTCTHKYCRLKKKGELDNFK